MPLKGHEEERQLEIVFRVGIGKMAPFKSCTAEDVKVQMFDLLPAVFTDIADNTVTAFIDSNCFGDFLHKR